MTRALVTGASGFIGRHLVEHLLDQDVEVVAAVRSQSTSSAALPAVVRTHFDLANPHSLDLRALENVDCVYHLAARVHIMREGEDDDRDFSDLNVRATECLARAAAGAGVRRFVFVSSIKAIAERSGAYPIARDDDPRPQDAYGRSKLEAEKLLAGIAAETGLEVAIVRPPLVYGPGVGANFRRLISLVERNVPLPFAAIENRRSLVNVWNLVDLLLLLGTHRASQGAWLISDGQALSTPELIANISLAMGKTSRLWEMPPSLLRRLGKLLGQGAEIARLTDSLEVDARPTCVQLQWSPRVSTKDGIARTVAWYLTRNGRE